MFFRINTTEEGFQYVWGHKYIALGKPTVKKYTKKTTGVSLKPENTNI